MIHPELQALFDERKVPTHASAQMIHDALRPILQVGALMDKQMAVFREHHLNAKFALHDHELDGKQERIRQTINVAQQAVSAFITAGDRLADAYTQLERYLEEDEAAVQAWEASRSAPHQGQ